MKSRTSLTKDKKPSQKVTKSFSGLHRLLAVMNAANEHSFLKMQKALTLRLRRFVGAVLE